MKIEYSANIWRGRATKVRFLADASPWGYGALLYVDGVLVEWLAEAITDIDVDIMQHARGQSDGQQSWEALVLLIAIRQWDSYWRNEVVELEVMSDSISALTVVAKLKATGRGPNIVARELALDLSASPFRPRVFSHLPGVTNTAADSLSRIFDVGASKNIASICRGIHQAKVPTRGLEWWRTVFKSPRRYTAPQSREEKEGAAYQ